MSQNTGRKDTKKKLKPKSSRIAALTSVSGGAGGHRGHRSPVEDKLKKKGEDEARQLI